MRRVKMLGLAVVAVLALGAAVTAAASAEVSFLPEGTAAEPVKGSGTAGPGTMQTLSGQSIQCAALKGTGEVTSKQSGHAVLELEGCRAVIGGVEVKCADLSHEDSSGIVKIEGEFHLRMG